MSEITAKRRPAAHPSVRWYNAATPPSDKLIPDRGKQLARLALGEAEIASPDLGDLVGKPELVQPDRRIPARRQHHPRRARQNREQTLELREGLSRSQLVEIVDDQHDGFEQLGQLRTDRVDQLVAVNPS